MIIVNADDFGLSNDINSAIFKSFNQGIISSTTLIVNMNDSFQDALTYVNNGDISKNCIGIHLNLEEGFPLTQNIKNIDFVCNQDGKFYFNFRKKNRFYFDSYIKKCVQEEISSQIQFFKNNIGTLPTHVDSHNHTHTEFASINLLLPVLRDHKIEKIRLTRNIGTDINIFKNIYKKYFNYVIKSNNFISTDYFGDITDFSKFNFREDSNIEIMVHPILNKNFDIVDLCGNNLFNKINTLFKNNIPNFVSYSNLEV